MSRPPLPSFTPETAIEKVRLAEDGWNSRDPAKVALAYTPDTRWRNRVATLLVGLPQRLRLLRARPSTHHRLTTAVRRNRR
jgi:nuclear transport factor 2 (NTF2) superfamily protein